MSDELLQELNRKVGELTGITNTVAMQQRQMNSRIFKTLEDHSKDIVELKTINRSRQHFHGMIAGFLGAAITAAVDRIVK